MKNQKKGVINIDKSKKKVLAHTKRWKKGQSCVTNPECRKFRDAAKNKNTGDDSSAASNKKSGLTCDALMRHNAVIEGKMMDLSNDDALSVGRESIATSCASSCTNATFKKVIHNFSVSNVAAHKEVLAVLETVAEMIKSKFDDDSDVKYLLTLLHLIQSGKVVEVGQVSAILYLLSLCVKRVPQPLLRSKFNEASKIILEALQAHVESESLSLVKSAITILTTLLRSLDYSSWKQESTRNIYFAILCLTDCDKHKVRKVAQHAMGAILRGSCFMLRDNAPSSHPATNETFEYCRKKLEERPKGTDKSYLYIIGLLGDLLSIFSRSHLEKLCEIIISIISPADPIASLDCLNCLRKMFAMRPKDGALTAQFNARIISELYKKQPTVQLQTMNAWILTTGKAYSNLAKLCPSTFLKTLPDFFKACFTIMSNQSDHAKAASEALMACISECTNDVMSRALEMSRMNDSPIHKIVKEMINTYSMLFMDVMETTLKITDRLMEFFGKSCSSVMKQTLKPLNTLYSTEGFKWKSMVMKVFATSVRTMGPEVFLEVIPLLITGENDDMGFPMSWILPLMGNNIQDTNLKFFIDYFVPILSKINNNLNDYQSDAARIIYQQISDQMWALLPGFCTRPTDLVETFPKLAKNLAYMIKSENSQTSRVDILAALRRLVNSSMRSDEERSVMERYSKNYIPLFCSMYTGTQNVENVEKTLLSQAHNRAVLETFKILLKVTPDAVLQSTITECFTRHESKDLSVFQKHLIVDLMICLISHMNSANLGSVCKISKEYIESKDKSCQKKGYRLLEEVCCVQSEAGHEFVSQNLEDITNFLIASLKSSDVVSKAPRLRCMRHVIEKMNAENMNLLKIAIPEAILCISVPGLKKKTAALGLLVEASKGYARWNSESSSEESFKKFMELLTAGLASSQPREIKCTVLAISEVMKVNKNIVSKELLEIIVANLLNLFKSKAREILSSGLELAKVLVSHHLDFMSLHVKAVVMSMVEMADDNKLHPQKKEIYVKMVKKLGYKLMSEMMPEKSRKIIKNIHKELDREKKKKNRLDNASDDDDVASRKTRNIEDDIENLLIGSDDDDDDDDDVRSSMSRKSRRSKKSSDQRMVFIENEEATDFLDPSAHKSVSVKKKKKKEKSDGGIKMIDGKLIITGDDDDDTGKKNKRKGGMHDDDDDNFDDCISRYTGHSAARKTQNARKRSRDDDDDDEDSDDDGRKSALTYKSGGTGIHRKNPQKPALKRQRQEGGKNTKKSKQGDALKAGVQPYAYIPLDKGMLNKRLRNKYKF